MPGNIAARARLLAIYADLLGGCTGRDKELAELERTKISHRFGELTALSASEEKGGEALLKALIAFGEAFIECGESALALDAYPKSEQGNHEDNAKQAIVAIKEFVRDLACRILVGKFESLRPEPLGVYYGYQGVRKNSSDKRWVLILQVCS
jgi:hypothetical protein